MTLATINSDGTPYCLPISHVLIENDIYFHCATEGQKLDNIQLSNNVCITGVRNVRRVLATFTTQYESAIATGKCFIVENEVEKINALKRLCEKYALCNMENFETEMEKNFTRTCVCKIKIETITGKGNI
jgi:nitroimidazol reductase NimA-like FMN-containing flavoprotein (pyridoxamine 5'-phosphate oxidase superfamily)